MKSCCSCFSQNKLQTKSEKKLFFFIVDMFSADFFPSFLFEKCARCYIVTFIQFDFDFYAFQLLTISISSFSNNFLPTHCSACFCKTQTAQKEMAKPNLNTKECKKGINVFSAKLE